MVQHHLKQIGVLGAGHGIAQIFAREGPSAETLSLSYG